MSSFEFEGPADEALELAFEDVFADSGNHEPLDSFLRSRFTFEELALLFRAAHCLANRTEASILSHAPPPEVDTP